MKFPTEREPDGNVHAPHHLYVGLLLAWFAFQFIWPFYAVEGAVLVGVGILIVADDYLSHAFGIWTPLDALFGLYVKWRRK